ncbi:hypothetical protein U9M48_001624 [Paspalum notatum var. saurae]|uniref:Uncharacterized protein n=1 Tax=Paspalum notatum var. saurae TaxID=547442 RepID=A0AAQ3PF38_PASNO
MLFYTASPRHGINSFRRQPRPSSSPRVDNVGDSRHASNEISQMATTSTADGDELKDDHFYGGRR